MERKFTRTGTRIYCLMFVMVLIFTLFPGVVPALEEGEQGHNHVNGYCYVCKEGDPSLQEFSYNVPEYAESEAPVVMNGEIPYWSLAEAIEAAAPGDTLQIQSSMVLSYPVMIDKDLTLTGAAGPDITIYRDFSGEAMFTVRGGAVVQTEYLTFDGCQDEGFYGYSIFHVLDGSRLVLSNGTTLQNNAADYGGGVYVDALSSLQMNGETDASQIRQCSAGFSGGAVYSEGSAELLQGAYTTDNYALYGSEIWTLNDAVSNAGPGTEDGSIDLYGGESCTVYFNPGDGSEPVPVTVAYGDTVSEPEEISWEGHNFLGWSYVPYDDGIFYPYDFSQPVYSSFTIYANWEQQEPMLMAQMQQSEFDEAWDPQPVVAQEIDIPPVDSQQIVMEPTDAQQIDIPPVDPQQTVVEPVDSQQIEIIPIDVQPADEQQIYDAPVYYNVNFDYNVEGWESEVQSVEAGGYARDPYDPAVRPRDSYELTGWYYYTNVGEFEFHFDQPVDQDYYLTAKWAEVQPVYVTVTYDPNDGISPVSTAQIEAGTPAAQASATREGYTFGGWYYYNDYGEYVLYDFGQAVYGDLTLYAEWTQVPQYTVSFDFNANGEIAGQTQTVMSGGTVRDPYDPVTMLRSGQHFLGWFYTDEYGTEYPFSFTTPITSDLSVYAKWEAQSCAVTFDPCNGSDSILQAVQYGQLAVQPELQAPAGYRLEGWYQDPAYVGWFDLANTPITGNITLYAKWELIPVEYYTVSFDANGHGMAPDPQTVKGGELAQKPAAPQAVGYTFLGWFTDAACTQAYNFQEPSNTDLILYAGWTVNRYTIRFDSNSGTGVMPSIDASYDQSVYLPAHAFTKSGFAFLGWNTQADGTGVSIADGGEVINLTDVNGGTVDLYAQWKNIYSVIEGANAKVMKGSGQGLTFRCDGDYSKFTGIRIDGQLVSSSHYTAAPGSTVVTLHANYIDQMNVGIHNLRFEYTDGGVETGFEVLSRTPTTGDTNKTLLWIVIAVAALVVIGVVIAVLAARRRRMDDDDPYFDDFGPGGHDFSREYDDGYDDGYDDEFDDEYDDDTGYEQYVDDQLRHRKRRK